MFYVTETETETKLSGNLSYTLHYIFKYLSQQITFMHSLYFLQKRNCDIYKK